jgi:hypothetical protein
MIRPSAPLVLFLLAASTGCLKPSSSAPVVLHTLSPIPAPAAAGQGHGPALEVMPVRLPEMLQRPQLVVAQGPGTLGLSETHRWGNPLDQDIQRVLVENLALRLGGDAVVASPYGERVAARYRLELEVLSCDPGDGGGLALKALWMVTPSAGGPALVVRRTDLREPLAGPDPEALVAAHNRILGALSETIASALKALAP